MNRTAIIACGALAIVAVGGGSASATTYYLTGSWGGSGMLLPPQVLNPGDNAEISMPGSFGLPGTASSADYETSYFHYWDSSPTHRVVYGEASGPGIFNGVSEDIITVYVSYDVSGPNRRHLRVNWLPYTLPSSIPLVFQATPEPSSWALMAVGIGSLGAALRRRRATAVGLTRS